MTLQELIKLIKKYKDVKCLYGTHRIESYDLDQTCMSGYDSGGTYKCIFLDSDEFDINQIREIIKCKTIWRKK